MRPNISPGELLKITWFHIFEWQDRLLYIGNEHCPQIQTGRLDTIFPILQLVETIAVNS